MKSKNPYYVLNNFIKHVRQHRNDYRSITRIALSVLQKVRLNLYQIFTSIYFKYSNYKQFLVHTDNIYIVYNLGKVGSTAVYDTLRLKLPHQCLFHVHFLTETGLKKRESFHSDSSITSADRRLVQLIHNNPQKRLKIITLVREPISREISAIFESLDIYFPDKHLQNISLEDLQNKMDENTYAHILNWFDEEFKEFLHIDIYSLPFNKSHGYQIYQTKQADVLLIRMEDLTKCFRKALFEFTGIHFNRLLNTNISTNKLSSSLNKAFKEYCKVSAKTLEKLYQSKYVQHFYSEQEIRTFIKKYNNS